MPIEISMLDQIAVTPQRQEHRADLDRNTAVFAQCFGDRLLGPGDELRTQRVGHTDKHDRIAYVLKPQCRSVLL